MTRYYPNTQHSYDTNCYGRIASLPFPVLTYIRLLLNIVATVRNWPAYFLQRLGLTRKRFEYRLRNGMTVSLRSEAGDSGCLNDVWLEKSYDPNAYGIPFDWSEAKQIVDVGGHIGMFTLFAASKAKHAAITTLEPDPENFVLLTHNVSRNTLLPRVTLHPVGLGNGEPVTLYIFPHDRGGNSVYREKAGGTPVTIETVSLKQLFDSHTIEQCDYLKLDCEGAEYEALYSLPQEYLERVLCMGIEYHHFSSDPTHNGDHLQSFLEKHGFRVLRHRKSMMLAVR